MSKDNLKDVRLKAFNTKSPGSVAKPFLDFVRSIIAETVLACREKIPDGITPEEIFDRQGNIIIELVTTDPESLLNDAKERGKDLGVDFEGFERHFVDDF